MRSRWRAGLALAPWLLVSLFAHAAALSWIARRMWIEPLAEPALPRPPEPLALPLFPTPTSAAIVLLLVLLPAGTVWMQRRWERRTEPLALAALSLACLGQMAAIGGGVAVAEHGDRAHPVNLVTLGVGLCVGAVVLGLAAGARILLDRVHRSGLPLALGAAACAAFAAWLSGHFLIADRFPRVDAADPELPLAAHTEPDRCDAEDPHVAILRIRTDGTVEVGGERLAPGPDLEARLVAALRRAAASMDHDSWGLPWGTLCVRAGGGAPWSVFEDVLRACEAEGVGLWRLHLAASWPEPRRRTHFWLWLPRQTGALIHYGMTIPGPRAVVLPGGRRFLFGGQPVVHPHALLSALRRRPGDAVRPLGVSPDCTVGDVACALDGLFVGLEWIELGDEGAVLE